MRAHNSVLAVYFDLILELLDGVSASHPSPSTSAAETKKEKKYQRTKTKTKTKKSSSTFSVGDASLSSSPFFFDIETAGVMACQFDRLAFRNNNNKKKKKKWVAMEFTLCCFDFLCLLAQFVYFCLFAVFVPSPSSFFELR